MHIGIADQRSEGPKPRGASDGVSLDMAVSDQATDQRRPGRRDISDELRIERAQSKREPAPAMRGKRMQRRPRRPAIEGAPEKPAAPVAEPGPRASVTAAGRAPEEAKAEEVKICQVIFFNNRIK